MTPSNFLRQIRPFRFIAMTINEYQSFFESYPTDDRSDLLKSLTKPNHDKHPLWYRLLWRPIYETAADRGYASTDYVVILLTNDRNTTPFIYFYMKSEHKPTSDEAIRYMFNHIDMYTSRPERLNHDSTQDFLKYVKGGSDVLHPLVNVSDLLNMIYQAVKHANRLYDAVDKLFCKEISKSQIIELKSPIGGATQRFQTKYVDRPVELIKLFKKYCDE